MTRARYLAFIYNDCDVNAIGFAKEGSEYSEIFYSIIIGTYKTEVYLSTEEKKCDVYPNFALPIIRFTSYVFIPAKTECEPKVYDKIEIVKAEYEVEKRFNMFLVY